MRAPSEQIRRQAAEVRVTHRGGLGLGVRVTHRGGLGLGVRVTHRGGLGLGVRGDAKSTHRQAH